MKRSFLAFLALVLALSMLLGSVAIAEVYPTALRLSHKRVNIKYAPGATNAVQLTATTVPALHTLSTRIKWASDDTSIATVDDNGRVKAVGGGSTFVRATIQGATRELSVSCRVIIKTVPAKSVTLSASQITLSTGQGKNHTAQLTAKVLPSTTSFPQVTWKSTDPRVASVSQNGLVTGVGDGVCEIIASVENERLKDKCRVLVRDENGVRHLTISAGGDIVLGGDKNMRTDKRFENIFNTHGAEHVLKNLKKVFVKDDLTILNLEGPLKGGGLRRKGRKYSFYGKPEYVNVLTTGSVEVANIVNNHIDDFGTRDATINILRNAGIVVSNGEFEPNHSVVMVDGIRVGLLGFMIPCSDHVLRNKIRKSKAECDVLIVSMHFCGNDELDHRVIVQQRNAAHRAVDNGADMILGHHTHVTSGIEVYQGKYIYYGLGAVESSGPNFKYPNFITQQTLSVDLANRTVVSQIPTIYPIFTSSAPVQEDNNCQPMLLTPGDPRYDELFDIIDRESNKLKLIPAPYKKG